jgi:hypothetical protein
VILVLTQPEDEPAQVVIDKLRSTGNDVEVFDPATFPESTSITIPVESGSATLHVDGRTLNLEEVSCAWVRRPGNPRLNHKSRGSGFDQFVTAECARLLNDLWQLLECVWVPARPAALSAADLRINQLRLAKSIGFAIPSTVVTNEPDSLFTFWQANEGAIVSKLCAQELDYSSFMRYTEPVTWTDVTAADSLRFAPAMLQAAVPKLLEVRVTVVGSAVHAVEIHSQDSLRTSLDWRHYDYMRTDHRIHELPRVVAHRCRQLVVELGLTFGAIDLILTPAGEYIFLELNPNGQWYWLEQLTGIPISVSLCQLLSSSPVRGDPYWKRA